METQSASSTGNELDRRRNLNAGRPTVIYFYGFLNKDGPKDLTEDPDMFFAKSNQTKCHGMNSSVDILESKCDVDEQQENAQRQDTTCLKSSNNRLPKRQRTSFTQSQLERLEEEFRRDTYIVGMKRWRLSEELEVPEKQIKIWFQNRRTKSSKTKKGC